MWVRDYVESLHQNSRATLLFGKNNVLVQPVWVFSFSVYLSFFNTICFKRGNIKRGMLWFESSYMSLQRDDMEAIPGYLSLHQTADLMTLKWTPNQLMNGNLGELDSEKRLVRTQSNKNKSSFLHSWLNGSHSLMLPSVFTGIMPWQFVWTRLCISTVISKVK